MSEINELLGRITAELLWEASAIQVRHEPPFTLTSGAKSPLYVDCRRLISNVVTRRLITSYAAWKCRQAMMNFDVVAGGESAGIPFAAFLAEALSVPMVYVRKSAREHGAESQVEGVLQSGDRVLLCEDLITDGQSKLAFIGGLRATGADVTDCLVVFDREEGGSRVLADYGVTLHALTSLQVSLQVGLALGKITEMDLRSVRQYIENPAGWSSRG